MNWKVNIEIKLKNGILDPQGQAVKGGLDALGYKNINDVHVGKYIELFIEGEKEEEIKDQTDMMCKRLLANPIIEDYTFQINKVEEK